MVMEVTLKMLFSDRGNVSRAGGTKLCLIFGDQKERRLDFQKAVRSLHLSFT
jgi:hypothetical protein